MKLCVSLLTILIVVLPASSAMSQLEPELDRATIRFVGDVLLGTEYGDDKLCVRWGAAPRLSTFSDGRHHEVLIKAVVNQLNACLPEYRRIEILKPDDESATLKVYFYPRAKFKEICENNDTKYFGQNAGYYAMKWNAQHQIENGIVLIAHDQLRGNRLQHFLLEEITQSLGLGGDSVRFEDSVFYEDQSIKKYGTATRLTKLDQKLIRFLYGHVKPGSNAIELGVTIGREWK